VTSVVGTATDTYTYPPASNRLSGINLAAGGIRAYTYDGAGNVQTDSRGAGYSYTYDAAGRMASMSINGVLQGTYKYDFAGRQAVRTIAATGVTIHSVFDSQGRRIAEYDEATGALIREYVWLGWEPVAVLEGGVTSLIRTDHIGRPVFATNATGVKVWTAAYDPFGAVRTTTGTPIPARFPGQWFQAESGLHQNWMRDYDPTTGRYLQADPLGLVDGASVYGYALQSPMMYIDPRGENAGVLAPLVCTGPQAVVCAAVLVCAGIAGAIIYNTTGDVPDDCTGACEPFLDPEGADHILEGHQSGAGQGKSEFPPTWGEDDIMHGVDEIAKSGNPVPGIADARDAIYKEGTVTGPDGIDVTIGVVIGSDGRIITGYPIYP
jgi:RHS repeat-associated protein